MALESLKDGKFETLTKESLRFICGGEDGESSWKSYTYNNTTWTDVKDRYTRENGVTTCLEVCLDGRWVSIL